MSQTLPHRGDSFPQTTPGGTCCGTRPPGRAGQPLSLSCQLCRQSPTYWGNTEPSIPDTTTPANPAAPLPAYGPTVDWSRNSVGDLKPCRMCGKPAMMRDPSGRPCHKVCGDRELAASQ